MASIEELNLPEDEIVVKYDQVYTPNQDVCPGKEFPSFSAMMEEVGRELDAASDYAFKNDLPFCRYVANNVIKPEFSHEVVASTIQETSD